ncbi:MAG: hypothetical protein U1F36_21570 [Planctomycetota bacterium]
MIAAAGLSWLCACGDATEAPHADPVRAAADTRDPSVVIDAILARTQGDRRGTFGRAIVELREAADGPATTISFELPDRMRVVEPEGRWSLYSTGDITTGIGESKPEPADESRRRWITDLRAGLDALCLLPLTRVARAERLDGDTLALWTRDDARFELDYDATKNAVRALRSAASTMTVVEDLDRAGRTRIPVIVELSGIGRRHVRFVDTGVDFQDKVFAAPSAGGTSHTEMVVGGPARSAKPRVVHVDAVKWLMMPDPGDWSGRMALFSVVGGRLGPLGYGNGGDPALLHDADGAWFVVPFVALDRRARPVVLEAGEKLVDAAEGRILAVDAEPGAWDDRIATAKDALARFATQKSLRTSGEVRLELNLIGRDPAADPDSLRDLPLRVVIDVARD